MFNRKPIVVLSYDSSDRKSLDTAVDQLLKLTNRGYEYIGSDDKAETMTLALPQHI